MIPEQVMKAWLRHQDELRRRQQETIDKSALRLAEARARVARAIRAMEQIAL